MKKRHQCIRCDEKATAFLYYDGGYLPFCVEHFLQIERKYPDPRVLLSIHPEIDEYMWRRK